jgi:cytochrome c-type biogenesis protein CcmH
VPERAGWAPLWLRVAVPLLVLGAALMVAGGVFSSPPPSRGQRVAAIERVVKCPSCDDVSVAESEDSTAIAVRHEIETQVAEGRSTAQIEQSLVAQYGTTILLEPPDTAGIALIWVVPIVLGVTAVGVVGALFWRRARQFSSLPAEEAA